ncbi:MAG: peptidoglycan DD-metalloendopeptidase family protein [Candidatus Tectomicrobia bacterium]|uniref:Peptidoglycan DD-metalloendopeptidase family protein n=1 Tax=Tectimicrobiota bacterium TaxID=2528274 RepID=A0A932MLK1_UNCTE|nr:peptidoglycan DD-metalloendopeptidase family protein [Candidatus Tectomicrobia bacterium]
MAIQLGRISPQGEKKVPAFRHLLLFGFLVLGPVPFLLGGCQTLDAPLQALLGYFRSEGDKGASEQAEIPSPPQFGALPSGRLQPDDAQPDDGSVSIQTGSFAPQDTVESLLRGNGLGPGQIQEVIAAAPAGYPLSRVGEGRSYEVAIGREGLLRLMFQLDDERRLRAYRTRRGHLRVRPERIPYDVEVVRLQGKIQGSLFETVARAGASPLVAMAVADIFGYVVDFHKELQEGDQIDILIERRSLHGKEEGFGRILAAKLAIGGRERSAYFFEPAGAYYSAQGETLRRSFLRSPLRYTRISSGFTGARFHPLLKRVRAHYGVDYAAPIGTPVRAVADGLVVLAGPQGEAGNMVRLVHQGQYETSYLHLSRFAKGIRAGRKVSQGDVIGYVGSTGLSTGPHLCYRIVRRGKPLDPISGDLPAGWPLPADQRAGFRRAVQQREAEWAEAPLLESAGAVASADATKPPAF